MSPPLCDLLDNIFVGAKNINVATITRRPAEENNYNYGKLDNGEISLIFAQLAKCINNSNSKDIRHLLDSMLNSSVLKGEILDAYDSSALPSLNNRVTAVLFNEMFFGKDVALTKNEVDYITEVYSKFSRYLTDAFLHINFMYKDIYKDSYKKQVEYSKDVYRNIELHEWQEPFMCFIAGDEQDSQCKINANIKQNNMLCQQYIKKILSSEVIPTLLFNQTKVFLNGREIGFYNKSSYFMESVADFTGGKSVNALNQEVPFYVMGDFKNYFSGIKDDAGKMWVSQVTNFLCYDVSVLCNDVLYKKNTKNLTLFCSNSHYCVMDSMKSDWEKSTYEIPKNMTKTIICADPEGRELTNDIDSCENNPTDAITGVFKLNRRDIYPIKALKASQKLTFRFGKNEYSMDIYNLNLSRDGD